MEYGFLGPGVDSVNWRTPYAKLARSSDFLQCLVLERGIGKGYCPAFFQQVSAQVQTFIKVRCLDAAPAHETAIIISAHYFTAYETTDFEVQCHRCA